MLTHLVKGKHIAAQVGFVDTFNELVDRSNESNLRVESVNGVSGPVYIVGTGGTDVRMEDNVVVIAGGGGGQSYEDLRPWNWNAATNKFENRVLAWGRRFLTVGDLAMPSGWNSGSRTVALRVTHPSTPSASPTTFALILTSLPITNDLANGYTDIPIARFNNGALSAFLTGAPGVPVYA